MKRILITIFLLINLCVKSFADEGMWLPQLLETLNEKQMKKMGMKLNASDIYSISKGSLKDAIVSFGGICTAEVISDKGLLLTNHHCGFDPIQNHSSLQNDYIKNGYWAYTNGQELPNPGLSVTFIVRIDDITKAILKNVTASMTEKERQSTIDKNIAELKTTTAKEAYQDILIKPFFEGNKYYLFITETYKDIRLVGAPPSAVGDFGKDTDNWMWPRHTGDFSMFRIYAGKDNKPADYSPDNVPYHPKKSLSISLDGVKEGDFTMVLGFPGSTREYLPSVAVKQIMEVSNPLKISIREKALQVIDGYMRKNEEIRIQYAAKYRTMENPCKKWRGEILGLTSRNAIPKKQAYEAMFIQRVAAKPGWNKQYGTVLPDLEKAYTEIATYGNARDYYNEIIPKIEFLTIASTMNSLVAAYAKDEASYTKRKTDVLKKLEETFKEYSTAVDQQQFITLMELYITGQPATVIAPQVAAMLLENNNSYSLLAQKVYAQTQFNSYQAIKEILDKAPADAVNTIKQDSVVIFYTYLVDAYKSKVAPKLNEIQESINKLQRTYMQAQVEVFTEKNFYPDANSTLRVTYGNVKGYKPRDAVSYDYYTYLDGLMEKYKPGDYEFDVPQKLIDLYNKKDFGQYGVNGKQPVCFIAANHTTGGNSGSPALDAYGNLVGLNFDRVWEGTMSDLNYDANICRNVMVDIRYVLFIVDKYAGAKNLIDELKLVHPKKK